MQMRDKQKLITCILPRGVAIDVVKTLKDERGIITANINTARGMGKLTPLAYRGVGGQTEKDILNIVVPTDQSDELFEYIYELADINRPHGGIIFMTGLLRCSHYVLPDLPDEK